MAPAGDREGYWGPTTSTLDWCEENYAVTWYIAEFWNTVSNLIMILPPIFGAMQSIRSGLEKRYIASYLALTVVGMGSWCFHMTLKYEMQLLDELPMIYSCCIFVYCMFECFKTKNSVNYHLLFTLVLFSLIVTIVYLKVKEPIFHQVMYGMLVFTLVVRSIYIVTWVYPWLRGLGYTSLGVFLLGFLLWNIDNIFCDSLRNFRKKLPPVIGVTTQFHAWWHILTGLGSYLHILFSLYTRTLYLRYRPKVKMAFPRLGSLKPKILTCLLVGLSFSLLHHWFLGAPRFQQEQRSDGFQQVTHVAPAATSPSSPGSPCVANASVNATPDFEKLPARIQDFLRYRHCRHFPLLWDAPAKCRGSRGPFLLLAVKSSPANFERRELIRRTWGQERSYGGRPVRRLFLLGTPAPEDAERAEQLAELAALEAREHGDVLQWAFTDTFLNLTLKHVHLLDWLEVRCPHARFLLSGDDDVFVHTANVLNFLEAKSPDRHLFAGQLMSGSVPIRESWSKYFVPPQLFPGSVYPVYCSGGGFLLSRHTVQALRQAARHTPLFPIDDAYMGMCLERVGLKPSGHDGIRPFGVQLPGARQPSFDPCMYRELLLVHRFAPYEMLLMWRALHDPGLSCHRGHRVS